MANKKVSYTTTKNINKAQSLIKMGTTTSQMAKLMNLSYNQAMYLRYLVNNKNQTSALKDKAVVAMVNTKKPLVNKKPRVSKTIMATKENVNVKRDGNNITVTINLAI
jgi:hypothetical protein